MGSTRLPGRVLADTAGRSMLWHVVNRARQAKLLDDVLVATSGVIDEVVKHYIDSEYDYVASIAPPDSTFPDGMDVEVLSLQGFAMAAGCE